MLNVGAAIIFAILLVCYALEGALWLLGLAAAVGVYLLPWVAIAVVYPFNPAWCRKVWQTSSEILEQRRKRP